jgi:hypothetical protein
MGRIKQKLERSCMGNMWENGRSDDKNSLRRMSKMFFNIEGQKLSNTVYRFKEQLERGEMYGIVYQRRQEHSRVDAG